MRCAVEGSVHSRFIGVTSVSRADAEHITKAVDDTVSTIDKQWKDKLVSIGSDGASVMTGKNTGVVVRLKGTLDYVIGMHCMNHRLELAYKDAVVNQISDHHKPLDKLLKGLYTFYHKSPLNRSNLQQVGKDLAVMTPMPTKVSGTRWVGHMERALDNFFKGFKATRTHLENVSLLV